VAGNQFVRYTASVAGISPKLSLAFHPPTGAGKDTLPDDFFFTGNILFIVRS